MADTWRSLQIYFATGFNDMAGERRCIQQEVLPELRHLCIALRLNIMDIDLRQGLSPVVLENLGPKSLAMMMQQIDRCRPFFVGLVGQQYGEEIDEYYVPQDPAYEWVRQYPTGRSHLELEMFYGAIRDPSHATGIFFMRDASYTKQARFKEEKNQYATPDGASNFPETRTDKTIAEIYLNSKSSQRSKLSSLKETIKKVFPSAVDYSCDYAGVEDGEAIVSGLGSFSSKLLQQLWSHAQKLFPVSKATIDSLGLEIAFHKHISDHHTVRRMIGRDEQLNTILGMVERHRKGQTPIILHGNPGCGLSKIVAHIEDKLQENRQLVVITHYIGSCPFSTSARTILRRVCLQLCKAHSLEEDIPEDYEGLRVIYPQLLKEAAARAKTIILLDGIHQLDSTHHGHMLHWIPLVTDAIQIFTATSSSEQLSIARRWDPVPREILVPPLTRLASSEIVNIFMWELNRALSVEQMNALLDKQDSPLPVFLSLACQDIHDIGAFDKVFSMSDRFKNYILDMPETLLKLGIHIVDRIVGDFPEEDYGLLVEDSLCLVACSRHGFTEIEMLEMLGPSTAGDDFPRLSPLIWSRLFFGLEPFLQPSPNHFSRQLQFNHPIIQRAVEVKFFADSAYALQLWVKVYGFVQARSRVKDMETGGSTAAASAVDAIKNVTARNLEEKYHSKIAKYFMRKEKRSGRTAWTGRFPRALLELPHHQIHGRLWDQLLETMTDLRFIEGKFRMGMGHDLLQDLTEALAAAAPRNNRGSKDVGRSQRAHKQIQDVHHFVMQYFETLAVEPRSCFQLAANQPDSTSLAVIARESWADRISRLSWVKWLNKAVDVEPCLATLRHHKHPVNAVCFTSDGVGIATADENGVVAFWDAYAGNLISFFQAHFLSISAVSIVPGDERGVVRGRITSSDTQMVTASRDKMCRLWDLRTCRSDKSFIGHEGRILGCAVSPDSKFIVTSAWDRTIRLWNIESGEQIQELKGHANAVFGVAVSPDCKFVVSCSDDEHILIWNLESGKAVADVQGHDNTITKVCFSNDGSKLLSSSYDMTIKLWSFQECLTTKRKGEAVFDEEANAWKRMRSELATGDGHSDRVQSCAFSPSGTYAVSGCRDGMVYLFDCNITEQMIKDREMGLYVKMTLVGHFKGHTAGVNSVGFSTDGWRLVSGSEDFSVKLWDFSGGSSPAKSGHAVAASGVCLTQRAEWGCSCSIDGELKYWDAREGVQLAVLTKNSKIAFMHCALSPDGLRAATAGVDGVVRVYDTNGGKQLFTQRHSKSVPVLFCCFSFYGANFATASADGTVKIWESLTGDLRAIIEAHEKPCNCVVYEPSNYLLATASDDGKIKVFQRTREDKTRPIKKANQEVFDEAHIDDLPTATDIHQPQKWSLARVMKGHKYAVNCVSFSHDGSHLASGGVDGTVRVWAVKSQEQLFVLDCRCGSVNGVQYSSDGSTLAAVTERCHASDDRGMLALWDARSYVRNGSFEAKAALKTVAIAGDLPCGVACGDIEGNVYWLKFGCVEPNAPAVDKEAPKEQRPTSVCSIL